MSDAAKKNDFFTYKGYPLVRKGDEIYYGNMYDTLVRNKDEIYYGNMSDQFVVWMQITEKTKVGDMDVASKVKIYKMATDEKLSPVEAIIKQSEKSSLYEALDIAYAWLSR